MEMETSAAQPPKTSTQFGILIGIISIVLFVVYYTLNIPQQGLVGFIPTIIFFILIIITQTVNAKAVDGNITFGNLFAMGFKTTALVVCINVIFIIIFLLAVPGFKEHAVEMARKKMEEKGNERKKKRMEMRTFLNISKQRSRVLKEKIKLQMPQFLRSPKGNLIMFLLDIHQSLQIIRKCERKCWLLWNLGW